MPAYSTYYRIAMLANPRFGYASLSWAVKALFEREGNTVFWFTPQLWGQLYCDDVVQLEYLDMLIDRWNIDFILVADGTRVNAYSNQYRGVPIIALDDAGEVNCLCVSRLVYGEYAARCAREAGAVALQIKKYVDGAMSVPQLANDLVCPDGVLCLQSAYADREDVLNHLQTTLDVPVRAFREGWGSDIHFDPNRTHGLYALMNSSLLVLFEGEDFELLQHSYTLAYYCMLHGTESVVSLDAQAIAGKNFDADSFQRAVHQFGHPAQSLGLVNDSTDCGSPSLSLTMRLSAIPEILERLGVKSPARIACVLGYVGEANFGDEFILSTIAQRLESCCPGTTSVAISENPWHTLVRRGIYAIHLRQKYELGEVMASASVAIVMAGLLFDQGMKWTIGPSSSVCSVGHSDIPGIMGFVQLAHLYDVKTVLYGIGAGPLENADARRFVKFMGEMGAHFLARDEQTAHLILESGVDRSQVERRADVAFTAPVPKSADAEAWLCEKGLLGSGRRYLLVSLRDYENVDATFHVRIAKALDAIARENDNTSFVFCLLDPDDVDISQRVIGSMQMASRCCVFDKTDDIDGISTVLEHASAGLSMRYHASLLLNKYGHPCVGLGYLPKVEALYHEVGCSDEFLMPMAASAYDLHAALDLALNDLDVSKRIASGVARLSELSGKSERELMDYVSSTLTVRDRARTARLLYFFFKTEEEGAANALACQNENLKKQRDDIDHQLRDSVELCDRLREECGRVSRERDDLKRRIVDLEQSNSYRVGSILMYVPGKIKHFIRRYRSV